MHGTRRSEGKEGTMAITITIEQAYARPIAVVHRTARLEDLATVVPDACGEVWRFARAQCDGNRP